MRALRWARVPVAVSGDVWSKSLPALPRQGSTEG